MTITRFFLVALLLSVPSWQLHAEESPLATVEIEDNDEPRGAEALPQGEELVNIDFPEPTEIKDIIKAVALWTGKNVILDRQVTGKVQIISPRKVTKEEAYQAFLSALNILGLTTVETGRIIKIMPIRTAVKGNLKTFRGAKWTPRTDEIITQIVPLNYINAKSIQTTLSRIVSSNSMIAYEPTNTLIISDTGYKVRRVLDIVNLLDVQTRQPRLEIIPIRFSDAKAVAEKVRQLVTSSSRSKRLRRSSSQEYKILVDERSNSVIIFGPPRTIKDVKDMVKEFDIELDDPSRQATIHVRPLDYADAKTLAGTLSALTGRSRRPARRVPSKTRPSPLAAVAQLDDNVKITAYEPSNSLLITGSRSAYQALNAIIRKLDMRRSQVYVETDILDINIEDSFIAGMSIFGGAGKSEGTKVVGTWEGASATSLAIGGAVAEKSGEEGAAGAAALSELAKLKENFSKNLTIGILSGTKVNVPGLGEIAPAALISLIKSDANTKILATPQILTSNNEVAKISSGETRLFHTAETNPTTGTPVQKLEKENANLSLKIKPNISHSNYVTLKIDLEANTFGTRISDEGLPNINKRQTSQLVTVKNGQTVVISGLMQTREIETFQKVPLFGDIPVLGWLFRNSSLNNIKTSLVIFLKPHIVHNAGDLAEIYRQKIKERDEFLDAVGASTSPDDDFYALLPKLEEGEYHSDTVDEMERRKLEEMRRELYEIIRDESNRGYPLKFTPEEPQQIAEPPAIEPPAIEPPAIEPPAVEPPAVEPPAVEPPAVEPPAAIEPPVVEEEEMPGAADEGNEAATMEEDTAAETGADDMSQTRPVP